MAVYMFVFWILILISGLMYWFWRDKTSEISPYVFITSGCFLVIAIVTKDPIFSSFGVPAEFEWVVGLVMFAIGSWKSYFNPMKNRIVDLELGVTKINAEFYAEKNQSDLNSEQKSIQ